MGAWNEITVGPGHADVVGASGRAIQIALDALARRGGGVVRLLAGEYICTDSVRLRLGVALVGQGESTVLRRGPLVWSRLIVDAATSQQCVTPEDAAGFESGMGICTFDEVSGWVHTQHPLVVTDVKDGVLHLAGYLLEDRLADAGGRVANYFPLIRGYEADHVVVEGLTVDGRVEDPDGVVRGVRTACVYLWRCREATLRELKVTGNPGDGICIAKSSIGARVERCESAHNGCFGIHPGSYSAECTVTQCSIHDNASDGLYICWGVSHGSFTDNHIFGNGWKDYRSGISIGHQDTDNLIARNRVHDNAKYGICFRRKTKAHGAHRVNVCDNLIENNGTKAGELTSIKEILEPWESIGAGVHVSGVTHDLVLENNTIRETREGDARTQRHAVVLAEGVDRVRMSGNRFAGHPDAAVVDESGGTHVLLT